MKRKTNKLRFGKCFGCFCGYSSCTPAKHRISRKQKKELKKFVKAVYPLYYSHWMCDDISSCDLATPYRQFRPLFHLTHFVTRWLPQIAIVRQAADQNGDTVYLTYEGRLGWLWEYDSDYNSSSGVMAFCYSKEEEGDTWAYHELHSLWSYLYKGHKGDHFPTEITSDIQLLEFIKNNPIPEKWVDED